MGAVIHAPQKLGSGSRRVHPGRVRPRGRSHPGTRNRADAPYATFAPAPWMMTLAVLAASCSVFEDRWA